jgi:UDPglucose 6-dehydrogenase
MKVSVVGLGKLGAPLLAVLASRGFDVCGIDINETSVQKINSGIAPVQEPGLQDLLTAHADRIRATTDWMAGIVDTDITFIIVPTPSGADGAFKNDYILAAIEKIGAALRQKSAYHLVVVNSTTMPGSVGGPIRQRLEAASGKQVGVEIGLCYNPEFIALGNVIKGLLNPDFVLIGESDQHAGSMLSDLYGTIVGLVPVARMNFVNAELTKISVNTYVTMKISFANMLGEICGRLDGADVDVVTSAIGKDTRIGTKYLRGGTGYGGPCFPRDTIAFSVVGNRVGVDAALATATHVVNERQVDRLVDIVEEHAEKGDTIAVLGLAYKPDTNVIEQSQGIMLATALSQLGYRVVAHDPLANEASRAVLGRNIEIVDTPEQAVAQSSVGVLMVPCPEYLEFFGAREWQGDTRAIIDCWRAIDRDIDGVALVQLGATQTAPTPAASALRRRAN